MSIPIKWKGDWVLSDPDSSFGVKPGAYPIRWLPFKTQKWGDVGARLSDAHLCRIYAKGPAWQVLIDRFDETQFPPLESSLETAKRAALVWVRDDLTRDILGIKADAEYEKIEGDKEEAANMLNDIVVMQQSIKLIDEALSREDLQSSPD